MKRPHKFDEISHLRRNRSKTFPLCAFDCYLTHPPIPGFSDLPTFIPANARSILDATGIYIHEITLYMFSKHRLYICKSKLKSFKIFNGQYRCYVKIFQSSVSSLQNVPFHKKLQNSLLIRNHT